MATDLRVLLRAMDFGIGKGAERIGRRTGCNLDFWKFFFVTGWRGGLPGCVVAHGEVENFAGDFVVLDAGGVEPKVGEGFVNGAA